MPTNTQVNDLKINVLTEAQYEQIQSPSSTELYLVPEIIDTTPTEDSTNPITSGGVYDALQNLPAQEQSDWNETDTTDPAYIKNKPQNIVTDASYVHTDNNYTTTEKNKLAGIENGAEVNVQSDWNQTDNTADDYIKNKPTLFSGSYKDLSDKPAEGYNIEIKPLVSDEYSMITWAANNSSTYINTGIVPDVDDIEIEIVATPVVRSSWYILQSRASSSASSIVGISGSSNGNTIAFVFCGTTITSDIARSTTSVFTVRAKAKGGDMSLYVKKHSDNTENTKTGTYTYAQQTLPLYMFGNQRGDYVPQDNEVHSVRVWKSGILVLDYKPILVKSNDNIAFFDTRTQSVITPNSGGLHKDSSDYLVETPISINATPQVITVYSGSSAPSSSLGKNGDIYIQTT